MDVQPHPTSPKHQAAKPMAKVWSEQQFERPRRLPWFGLIVLMIVVNVVVTASIVVGWGWLTRNAPHIQWLQWLPQSTSTTIVQPVTTTTSGVPTRVQQSLGDILAVAPSQGTEGIYTASQEVGLAIPLSTDGWSVSLTEAVPAGTNVLLPTAGLPLTISSAATDPASSFVFLKTDQLSIQPATLATDPPHIGQTVWVVSGQIQHLTVVSRHIVGINGPHWLSSDIQEQTWQLDQTVTTAAGAAVLNDKGQVIGLLGQNNHVWPASSISGIINGVVQHGRVTRPSVGLRYLMLDDAVASSTDIQHGALIGADANGQPIQLKGPADKAGMKSGDIITDIDSQPVRTDFGQIVSSYRPGQTVTLILQRDGKSVSVKLTVGTLAP